MQRPYTLASEADGEEMTTPGAAGQRATSDMMFLYHFYGRQQTTAANSAHVSRA
jgi:hypothetical protein